MFWKEGARGFCALGGRVLENYMVEGWTYIYAGCKERLSLQRANDCLLPRMQRKVKYCSVQRQYFTSRLDGEWRVCVASHCSCRAKWLMIVAEQGSTLAVRDHNEAPIW